MNTLNKLVIITLILCIFNVQCTPESDQDDRIMKLLECEQPNLPAGTMDTTAVLALSQMKKEFLTALTPYKTKISASGTTIVAILKLVVAEIGSYANDLACMRLSLDIQKYDYLQIYGN